LKTKQLDDKEIMRLYIDEGKSSIAIGKKFGVPGRTIRNHLIKLGVPIRGRNKALMLRWKSMNAQERENLIQAGQVAKSKRKQHPPLSHNSYVQNAVKRQTDAQLNENEKQIMKLLNSVGLNPIPQYAFDVYNIDLAFPEQKVAVEVDSCWHNRPSKVAGDKKKESVLKAAGWIVVRFKVGVQNFVKMEHEDALPLLKVFLESRSA
jgi:very-short-patch-repair endonuclease